MAESHGVSLSYGNLFKSNFNKAIVGMASAPDGNGYWLVASDGGIYTHGDAQFFGSLGSQSLSTPVVGMSATPF